MMHLMLAMLCGAAFSARAAQQAALDGAHLARAHAAYGVRPWVLYQSKDPLSAIHGKAGVDAVIVETPYERVRYDAYLQAMQGLPVRPQDVARWRSHARNEFGFLVYAHSRSDADRTFLRRFRPAPSAHFGPSLDFYDVGTFREQRWAGSITYRFPVRTCDASGTFAFAGPYGKRYRFPYRLNAYR